MILIDGKKIASELREDLKKEVYELKKKWYLKNVAFNVFDAKKPNLEFGIKINDGIWGK